MTVMGSSVLSIVLIKQFRDRALKGIADLKGGMEGKEANFYPQQIAYNCLPHIDVFADDGYTKEELKMVKRNT